MSQGTHDSPATASRSETSPVSTAVVATTQGSWLVELTATSVWAIVADGFLFHARGYLAVTVFFSVAVGLLLVVNLARRIRSMQPTTADVSLSRRVAIWVAMLLMGLVLFKMTWLGSPLLVLAAVVTFAMLAMVPSGWYPTMPEAFNLVMASPIYGVQRLSGLRLRPTRASTDASNGAVPSWMTWLIPVGVSVAFVSVFVFANPDALARVRDWSWTMAESLRDIVARFSAWELPFLVVAFFVGSGLLRPLVPGAWSSMWPKLWAQVATRHATERIDRNVWHSTHRNTLVMVIVVFAAYLPIEFVTLFKRDFPEGFYYAGYAHQGAAWLAVALLMSTIVLSMIFGPRSTQDPRTGSLRRLAWIWTGLNWLLAVAVYNRLMIYVGYNGMTTMRSVAFFGVTLVIVGFALVVIKIHREKTFAWLIHSQLIALMVAVVVYAIAPIDYVTHRYNASRVIAGDDAPSVMIAVKPMTDEGRLSLISLVDHPDPVISEGVRAMLAQRQLELKAMSRESTWHWHRYQSATHLLARRIATVKPALSAMMSDEARRSSAIARFRETMMKWY
ncbi:MAG: DUF4153 domain-containing protein [Planctomycetota bacterium]